MGWARLDDGFHDHPKLIGLPLDALGLWTKCFTWAHRHQGSSPLLGHVPEGLPTLFAGARGPKLAALLVKHRLWDLEDGIGGWQIHDYDKYLPATERPATADDVRKARSEAGKRGAKARWDKQTTAKQVAIDMPGNRMTHVDGKPMPPTRPDQNPDPSTDGSEGRARKRATATRIPDPFYVTAEMRSWATTNTPDIDVNTSTAKFVDHWRAKAGRDATKQDWTATWRNWLRSDAERAAQRRPDTRQSKDDRARATLQLGADLTTPTNDPDRYNGSDFLQLRAIS